MKKLLLATFSLAVASSAGFAADLPSKKSTPVAAAACSSSWAVSAREWYAFHRTDPGNPTVAVPMTGGSLSYVPSSCSGIAYTLTALYGQAPTSTRYPTDWVWNNAPATVALGEKFSRFDVEASIQIPLVENFAGNVGVRFVNAPVSMSGKVNGVANAAHFDIKQTFVFAELGGVYSAKISPELTAFAAGNLLVGNMSASAHNVFPTTFNLTLDTGGEYGFDVNAGMKYSVSNDVSVTGRYRVWGLSKGHFKGSVTNTLIHGPELSATYRF